MTKVRENCELEMLNNKLNCCWWWQISSIILFHRHCFTLDFSAFLLKQKPKILFNESNTSKCSFSFVNLHHRSVLWWSHVCSYAICSFNFQFKFLSIMIFGKPSPIRPRKHNQLVKKGVRYFIPLPPYFYLQCCRSSKCAVFFSLTCSI